MRRRRPVPPRLAAAVAGLALLAAATLAACGTQSATDSASTQAPANVVGGGSPPTWTPAPAPAVTTSPYRKVLVIAEENEAESSVIGSSQAPYLTRLASSYGYATNMVANYPVSCPSLAAYLIMTSGDRQGICDDDPPANHQLSGDNIFQQVANAGLEWRQYAESMPANCSRVDGPGLVYLVRHAPPPYYASESSAATPGTCPSVRRAWATCTTTCSPGCRRTRSSRRTPATTCTGRPAADRPGQAGRRLGQGVAPPDHASPDFLAARLVVIITWDEGSTPATTSPPW